MSSDNSNGEMPDTLALGERWERRYVAVDALVTFFQAEAGTDDPEDWRNKAAVTIEREFGHA